MTGFYADAPDYKLYYESDGSVGFTQNPDSLEVSPLSMAGANDESLSTAVGQGFWSNGLVFPHPVDVTGIFVQFTNSYGSPVAADDLVTVRTSVDTTNGADGTWVVETSSLHAHVNADGPTVYRQGITAVSYEGITGLSVQWPAHWNSAIQALHLYGGPAAGENPNRLRFWDPTADTEIAPAHFDFSDLRQVMTDARTFRVKNNSATLSASGVTVTVAGALAAQTTFSSDDLTWASSLDVGELSPGEVSALCHVRLALPADVATGLVRQRLDATADSWWSL